ncbi:hypothetical protein EV2_009374 [Malus domestica]
MTSTFSSNKSFRNPTTISSSTPSAISHFITLYQSRISNTLQNPDPDHLPNLRKSLCLAISNRAEAQLGAVSKLRRDQT